MALVFADLVRETTSTTGTGTLTLTGAVANYQSFAAIGNANTTYYRIISGADSEVGIGTYTVSGTTLSRDTVLYSSAGGTTKITVAGGATVICTYPAEKVVILDGSGNATALGTPAAFVATNITGTASGFTAGNVTTNANLTGGVTSVGNATTVVTNANRTGAVTSSGNATSLGSFTSLQLKGALTDETGSGAAVFATSPTLDSPTYTGTLTGSTGVVAIGTNQIYKDASGNVGIGTSVNSVYDGVAQPRPLVVQSASTATGQYNSTNALVICNSDTTTNNASQLNFAAITGASTNQYTSAVISCIYGARTNTIYPTGTLTFATSPATQAPVERMRINSSGNVLVTNPAGLGYGAGSGGTVTQATDKSTGVTLNKPSGRITMVNTSLAANTNVFFILTNSTISTGDLVLVNILDNAAPKSYQACAEYSRPGYVSIMLRNTTGASLSEDVVLTFAVIKGANS